MADLSVAVLVGRLTRDAELKFTNSGQAICHFSVATGTRRKKGDQWVDEPSFWDVDLWGKQGESLNQYLTKGKLVAVEGTMRQDRWEQDGQTRSKVIINANSVQLLGGGQGGPSSSGSNSSGGQQTPYSGAKEWQDDAPRAQGPASRAPASDDFSDDIPF
ncbi:MAG TPA: single-stranded DNA-binding protein [Spirochaetaceae bacterium]|jgi:single-strand DNA-binding protein|nr:single-stranded DNA-binding protein [Spirochaetaceae bacterium]